MRDPYLVLGVDSKTSAEDVKKAYRKLAKKYHPDFHPGDKEMEKKFKEISVAYDILGDAEKRRKFDMGEIDAGGNERQPNPFRNRRPGGNSGAGADPFSSFFSEDIFGDFFGAKKAGAKGGARGGTKIQGADINYSLRISFLDAVRGVKRQINLDAYKTLNITIPAGTRDGDMLRLKGQGKPGINGGPSGDAFIEIHVDADDFYEVRKNDIYIELPITLDEAVLGTSVTVPTVDGKVSVNIPPNSNTGNALRLKNKGILDPKSKIRGDQYVRLKVVLPEKPDKDLTHFVEKWAKKNSYDVRREFNKKL